MDIIGSCVLRISSNELNFEDISRTLNLSPTKIVTKGQLLTRDKKSIEDMWFYELELTQTDTPTDTLNKLTELIVHNNDGIKKLMSFSEVYLALYLQSDFAQMGFEIPSEIIQKLAILELGLDVHILSWGGVKE